MQTLAAEIVTAGGLKLQTSEAEIVTALAAEGLILTECAHGIA